MMASDLWRMGVLETGIDTYMLQVSLAAMADDERKQRTAQQACAAFLWPHSRSRVCHVQDPTSEWLKIHPVLRQAAAKVRVGELMVGELMTDH